MKELTKEEMLEITGGSYRDDVRDSMLGGGVGGDSPSGAGHSGGGGGGGGNCAEEY